MALDLLGEDFERGAVANGELICNRMRAFSSLFRRSWKFK